VPSVTLRGLDSSGELTDILATDEGALAVSVVDGTITLEGGATAEGQDALLDVLPDALDDGALKVSQQGSIALDATTLAALENIVVSGSVALDASALTALENIIVSGQVSLDATTLAALESVTASVTGTVGLDAAAIDAIEAVATAIGTADANRNADDDALRGLVATEATLDAIGDKLPSALDADRLSVRADYKADTVVTGTITAAAPAAGGYVTANVPAGARSMVVYVDGSVGTISTPVEATADGTNWTVLLGLLDPIAAPSSPPQQGPLSSNSGVMNRRWESAVPAGATQIRLRASTYTSGTLNVRIAFGFSPATPIVGLGTSLTGGQQTLGSVSLPTSTNIIGHVRAASYWSDDTTTPLAAAGTFTGTGRDLTATNAGNATLGGTSAKEFRGLAVSDVAGTLYLEVSRDNSTWRRIAQAVAVQTVPSGLFVAELQHLPATRYARWVFVNGAGAQTHFMLQTMMLAA
jgi:hypothetical protein